MELVQVLFYIASDETMLYLDLLFLALTTILDISLINSKYISNWVSSKVKNLSMTVIQFITSVSPEFNF